jgi:hypothetical protein
MRQRLPADYTDMVVRRVLTTPDEIRTAVDRLTDIGADEIIFYCWYTDTGQFERFAEALS